MAIGEGEIDLRGIFAQLHEIGYEGALALEIEPDTSNFHNYIGLVLSKLDEPLEAAGAHRRAFAFLGGVCG